MCLIVRVGVLCGQGGAACGSINSGLVWRSCAYFYPSVGGFTSMSNSGFFIGFFFFFLGGKGSGLVAIIVSSIFPIRLLKCFQLTI